MKLVAIFALIFLPLVIAEDKGVTWTSIDPFCGQVRSSEPEQFPVAAATIKLYRAKAKHLPCCDYAEPLGNVRVDSKGKFDLRKLHPGQYWLIAAWSKVEVAIPLWSDGKHHFACDERFNNLIEINPSTKTAERTIVTSTNSLTHAQTN